VGNAVSIVLALMLGPPFTTTGSLLDTYPVQEKKSNYRLEVFPVRSFAGIFAFSLEFHLPPSINVDTAHEPFPPFEFEVFLSCFSCLGEMYARCFLRLVLRSISVSELWLTLCDRWLRSRL